MAKFPIQQARQELGFTPATAVRGDIDTRTGEGLVGAAIGQGILALGSRWYIMDADTQLSEAKTKAQQEHIRLILELPDLEPWEHSIAYDKSIKLRQGFVPKNRMAANAYNRLLNSSTPQWGLDVTNATKAKLKDNSRATGFVTQQEAIRTGSFDEYFTHLAKGKMLGVYDAEEVVKYKQATIDSRERFVKLQAIQQKEQLEVQREIDRDKISDMTRAGEDPTDVIEDSSLIQIEQDRFHDRYRAETERRLKGEVIVTDQARKHELLDMVAAINWPERQVTAKEVRELAYDGRYGVTANLDDAAYDEVRDAIRKAEEDKIPFTKKHIETTIGELITGAPSSVLGLPLPTLRTREDAIRHATNAFGRFVNRIPGVMDTIDAKFPPEKRKSTPIEPKGTSAHDFDGELIGSYNPDGSITLNQEGTRRLWEIAGRDTKKARQMADQNRYIIPNIKE